MDWGLDPHSADFAPSKSKLHGSIPNVKVPNQIRSIIEQIIFNNNVVVIGESDDNYREFFNIANIALKLQNKPTLVENDKRIAAMDLDDLSFKEKQQVQKHLYETRTSIQNPYIAVCGKSYTTMKSFASYIKSDNGEEFCRFIEKCPDDYLELPRGLKRQFDS